MILSLMGLTACQEDQASQDASVHSGLQQPKNSTVNPPNLLKKAKAQNSCPRLVQKKVDLTQILRHDTLATDSCDYFIYPNIGDTVEVSVSDRRIELKLTRPDWHDFDNGGFMVTKNGRHVIRLQYDTFGSRPPIMDYVIQIDIIPPKDEY